MCVFIEKKDFIFPQSEVTKHISDWRSRSVQIIRVGFRASVFKTAKGIQSVCLEKIPWFLTLPSTLIL